MSSIIIHGGAGHFPEAHHGQARQGCSQAYQAGLNILKADGSALDAVEAAVRILENNPVFDAGRGSYPNAEGGIEMDAIIVDGQTLRFGAVACLKGVANPISVARHVMTDTTHCLLAGPGATQFARETGFPLVNDDDLRPPENITTGPGTVGAVALDAQGHVAAATSTGGMRGRMPGRVGDSPIIGCGAIAEDGVGAISCTGHGERIMRVLLARRALDYLRDGTAPMKAAAQAMEDLHDKTEGTGGLICLDAKGNTGFAFTTEHMARAHAGESGAELLTQPAR